jgi:hypothetical protein
VGIYGGHSQLQTLAGLVGISHRHAHPSFNSFLAQRNGHAACLTPNLSNNLSSTGDGLLFVLIPDVFDAMSHSMGPHTHVLAKYGTMTSYYQFRGCSNQYLYNKRPYL